MSKIYINARPIYSKLEHGVRSYIRDHVAPIAKVKINDSILNAVSKFVEEVQEKIIKPKVPKRTGKLRNSIKLVVKHSAQTNIIITCYAGYPSARTVGYAPYIEEGTNKHKIKSAKIIHFVGYRAVQKQPKYAKKKHYSKNMQDVFIRGKHSSGGIVEVRGVKARHYMKHGINFLLRRLPSIIRQTAQDTKL